jgi:peptidoglycan hydrolase-like protein with peptidoglycan-binding domain
LALKSNLFKGSRGLAACEINDAAHFTIGKRGDDVGRIQMALFAIDSLKIDRQELLSKTYGQSTASAVLAFKAKRKIINYAYQNKPDNIVGKMTIAALDREMSIWEATHRLPGDCTPAVRAARTGFHPQINFALSSSAVTAPQPQINKHTLRIYCSITKKASVENGYPLGQLWNVQGTACRTTGCSSRSSYLTSASVLPTPSTSSTTKCSWTTKWSSSARLPKRSAPAFRASSV